MIDVQRLRERWAGLDVMVRDLPLALLLAAASLVPALHGYGTRLAEDLPSRPVDGWAVAVAALECLPLVLRRRRPALCLMLVAAGFAADQLFGYHLVAGTALPIALVSAGAHLGTGELPGGRPGAARRVRVLTAVAVTVAYVPLAVALDRQGSREGITGYLTFYLAVAFAWGIGAWLRVTRAAEAERRRHVAESTRAAERARIARDLHDVVTHHVTAMVVQAEAARYLTAAPDRLDESLAAVAGTGRRAISDLRRLLDVLNPVHGGQAGSHAPVVQADLRAPVVQADLHAPVALARGAGQPVEVTESGRHRETPGDPEAVAHRVVQESLTNALKHAHGRRTVVHLHHGAHELTVEVSTDGGRGLTGLAERVQAVGGTFTAAPRPDGGFTTTARIPL
ncbi:sensor histidine kinase [Dactylosporangium sp. NPDC000521]|uniref:sensor histidine kinase n=1 Tax=Dactylosporangium sp. NPDC000521 TaxID=3363975 RepID=UPI0036907244